MNKNYTLKELADIGASNALRYMCGSKLELYEAMEDYKKDTQAREGFVKAILDAIGYELPKNEELEAFDRWLEKSNLGYQDTFFEIWKAGREELRKAINKPQYSMLPTYGGVTLL